MTQQPSIKIDDKTYTLDQLPEQAKRQLIHLQAAEQKIKQLQMELAITQTAKTAYAQAIAQIIKQNEQEQALKAAMGEE